MTYKLKIEGCSGFSAKFEDFDELKDIVEKELRNFQHNDAELVRIELEKVRVLTGPGGEKN